MSLLYFEVVLPSDGLPLNLSRLYRLFVWPLFPTANIGFCSILICDQDTVDAVFIFDF